MTLSSPSHKQPHRWGYKNSAFELNEDGTIQFTSTQPEYAFFANQPLPNFATFIQETLDISLDKNQQNVEASQKRIPPSHVSEEFAKAMEQMFPKEQFTTENQERLIHSHGQTTTDEVYKVVYNGTLTRTVDMVLFVRSSEDCRNIIQLAKEHNICLVPYGGGTSVSSALLLPENETRTIVSVDTKHMNQILSIDENNQLVRVQAGMVGQDLEKQLAEKGYTVGHEPDSIEFSTVGGWVSTFASGMKRHKYGNIEDIVVDFELLTPNGTLEQKSTFDRSAIGVQPRSFTLGSEGNIGIITEATLKIHPLPEVKQFNSMVFPNVENGIKLLKELSQTHPIPASVRLVDNPQFRFGLSLKVPPTDFLTKTIDSIKKFVLLKIKKMDPMQMCLATVLMEGSQAEVAQQQSTITRLAKKHKAVLAGESNGKRGYLLTNLIAYIRDFLADHHCIGETLETTVPWSQIESLCAAVNRTVQEQHKKHKLTGNPYCSYRITQLYHSSVCIYFTIGLVIKEVEKPEEVFAQIEESIRETVLEHGGSVSHHHGIGKLRKRFMDNSLTSTTKGALKAIKKELDPQNIFGIQNNVLGDAS
jgi:alkyldihydroxyacetonephosphate synthase